MKDWLGILLRVQITGGIFRLVVVNQINVIHHVTPVRNVIQAFLNVGLDIETLEDDCRFVNHCIIDKAKAALARQVCLVVTFLYQLSAHCSAFKGESIMDSIAEAMAFKFG